MDALLTMGHNRSGDETVIGFLLTPTYSMLSFISFVEPMRIANRLSGRNLYRWVVLSTDGEPVVASNGMMIPVDAAIGDMPFLPMVAVNGPYDPRRYENRKVFAWLRSLDRHGAMIGALCTGGYLLARAGLMRGYRCTIHWENMVGFAEDFPEIDVTAELFEIDRNRFTCAGASASMDMMLHFIAREHGQELALQVSETMILERIREPYDQQRMALRQRLGASHPKLLGCIALMETNLEEPLTPNQLAASVGVSKRQMERLFRRYLGTTPTHYYMDLRLKAARRLLEQTSHSIADVAFACGFSSPAHFSLRYRGMFGASPRQNRQAMLNG